jgi:hypothetical protein
MSSYNLPTHPRFPFKQGQEAGDLPQRDLPQKRDPQPTVS